MFLSSLAKDSCSVINRFPKCETWTVIRTIDYILTRDWAGADGTGLSQTLTLYLRRAPTIQVLEEVDNEG